MSPLFLTRGGIAIASSLFAMTFLGLMSSLAVDFGRIRAAKIVPPGATRLYFGVNDSVAWRDNAGYLTVTTTIKRTVQIVR